MWLYTNNMRLFLEFCFVQHNIYVFPNTLHNINNMNSNGLGRVLLILDLNPMVSHQTNKEANTINWSKLIPRYSMNKVQENTALLTIWLSEFVL